MGLDLRVDDEFIVKLMINNIRHNQMYPAVPYVTEYYVHGMSLLSLLSTTRISSITTCYSHRAMVSRHPSMY
jgi:hypothetical protein